MISGGEKMTRGGAKGKGGRGKRGRDREGGIEFHSQLPLVSSKHG